MKKKGFTLVELLAVIAILAILVIVAMPNVLGMFNQAKANTFVTEVQKYMDTAKTSFMTEAMQSGGQEVIFSSEVATGEVFAGKKELAMDGAEKTYVIWFDRNGNFDRVVIYDDNFCYDSKKAGITAASDSFDKSGVKVEHVMERDTDTTGGVDSLTSKTPATTYPADDVIGCTGTTPAKVD